VGPQARYGAGPDDLDAPAGKPFAEGLTRARVVEIWVSFSELIYDMERLDLDLSAARALIAAGTPPGDEAIADIERHMLVPCGREDAPGYARFVDSERDVAMNHYLIVFDRAESNVVRCEPFSTRGAALNARFDAEREFRRNDQIEVVVLGASSPEALARTHSRYFKGLGQLFRAAMPTEQPA